MRKPVPFTLLVMTLLLGSASLAMAQSTTPVHQVKVFIAPRSTMATAQLLSGFQKHCPNVSIVLDEPASDYVMLAEFIDFAAGGTRMHYYITLFSKQGEAVFGADKIAGMAGGSDAVIKEVCRFINAQK